MESRLTYLVRIWLPDRPGALGLVASRLGALRGDVVGLEIMEREGGLAIDELVVSLPDDVPVSLIVREVSSVDEVTVEDIRLLDGSIYDPQLEVLEAAAIVLGSESGDELALALSEHVCRAVKSSWACVVEPGLLDRGSAIVASWGDCPNDRWLAGFIAGSPAAAAAADADDAAGPPVSMEAVWFPLPAASLVLVVGSDSTIRAKERHRLAALARIADAWFRQLKERSTATARAFHPDQLVDPPSPESTARLTSRGTQRRLGRR